MDTLSWVCYPKEIHLIPCVLVICKLQCWHRIDHKFSMHEILDDVTPCFHFHAQPLYHNLDIWPCFGHSKEYDFDSLLPECLFYCKNTKLVCYNIIYSSTLVVSKLKKKLYDLVLKLPRESSKERSLWGNSAIFFYSIPNISDALSVTTYTHMTILLTNFGTSHVLLPFSPSNQRLRLRKTAVMRVKMSYIYLFDVFFGHFSWVIRTNIGIHLFS